MLQTAQALPVVAIDHTRATRGPAAYGEVSIEVGQHIRKVARRFGSVLRTRATPGEAAE